jgi:hypothetical protein
MRQVMPHRNNMRIQRGKGKRFLGHMAGVSGWCGESATHIPKPQKQVFQ